VNQIAIAFGSVVPIPAVLKVTTPNSTLNSVGATAQLTITSTFADGTSSDLTTKSSGTNYTTSNPAVATVSPDGLVTDVSSGSAIISAMNEGALGVIAINVILNGASHGGIPDDWAIAHGLDPNDPAMPFEDPDHDGLTNLQEFQHSTDPHNPDTDGDGIPDGLEVAEGTDPLNPNSFSLAKALKSIQVTPPAFTINFNTLLGEGSRQLIVTGTLNDAIGTQIDLTSARRGTNYLSSDLTVCNFGAVDGQVFAGNSGTCTITVSNNGFTAKTTGIIKTFSPTPLSFVSIPGFANNVKVNGDFAYVAAGSAGLQVVDVSDRSNPRIVASLATPGNAADLRVVGNRVYLAAGTAGLLIIDISNPPSPALLGSLATGDARDVAVSGNLAFIAAGSSGLQIANIGNPAEPVLIGSATASGACSPGTSKGVALSGNFAVVAAGSGGLQVVNISDPANPQVLGCVAMPSNDAQKVQVKGSTAFVAPYTDSLQIVDFSVPSSPVIVGTTSFALGGRLQDVAVITALGRTLTFGADVFFVNGVPITDVTVPSNPVSRAIIDFRQFRDDNGHGIAVDSAYVYMTGEEGSISEVGITGNTRLYIGQYLALEDTAGIPPTASIVSPIAGSTVIERQTIPVTVLATDDIAVASVSLTVNGQVVDTQTSPPYQFNFQVPVGVSTVTLGSFAVDLGGNVGNALPVQLNVIPDPGTTVVGTVFNVGGNPVAGAAVSTFGGRSSTTGSDGSFSIIQVPTVLGNIAVTATFVQPDGSLLKGVSAPATPVALGITQVGTITVVPVPVIISLSRKSALAGTQITFHVTGTTLTGSTFSFLPASSPAMVVKSSSIDPTGTSATLTVSVPAGIAGTFALAATNIAGTSNATITPANRFTVVNPASRADSDGDGFADVVEAFFGTDPLDPNSIPVIPSLLGEAESPAFTILNNAQPAAPQKLEVESPAFTLLNASQPVPAGTKFETASTSFTVLNGAQATGITREADSQMFSLLNNSSSVTPGANRFEAEGPLFSIRNAIPPAHEAESLLFTVLNEAPSAKPIFREADSLPFSLRNTAPPPPHVVMNFETESLPFTLLNSGQPAGATSREVASPAFTVFNNGQPAGPAVLETESVAFSVLNNTLVGIGPNSFEADSPVFSIRNTSAPPVPGARKFEAESLLFTLLNLGRPTTPVVREAQSPGFSLLNTNTGVLGSFEAASSVFTLLNGTSGAPGANNFEAESPVFTLLNAAQPLLTREAESQVFSLLNNSPGVVPRSFELESLLFSIRNATPAFEKESLPFTLLNKSLPSTPVFREAESLLFSARNTAPPPPHIFGKFETESLPFTLLNSTVPPGNTNEMESVAFSIRNESQPAIPAIFEADSALFSILNNDAVNPGPNNFEAESLVFFLRNTTLPPVPGANKFEAESLLFTLLNAAMATRPTVREGGSALFSILNTNGSGTGGPMAFEAESSAFTLRNDAQAAIPLTLEKDSNAFSLLNAAPAPLQAFETDGPRFTVRNTAVTTIAKRQIPVATPNKKREKTPARRQAPGAALRSAPSDTTGTSSQTSGAGDEKSGTTESSGTTPDTGHSNSGKSTRNSNDEQRSQHVSPTLEPKNQ